MSTLNDTLKKKLKNTRLLLLDIDGVMTDGTMWFSPEGTCYKPFHAHDGMGITQLRKHTSITVGVISGHPSKTVQYRLEQLHVQHIHLGCDDKLPVYQDLLSKLNLTDEHVCYIGDDINDLPILARAGMKVAVNNAMPVVKAEVDYVTQRSGGQGAVREMCDFLIEQHRP